MGSDGLQPGRLHRKHLALPLEVLEPESVALGRADAFVSFFNESSNFLIRFSLGDESFFESEGEISASLAAFHARL